MDGKETARASRRARRCYQCGMWTWAGAFRPYTDGRDRWACDPCRRRDEIDLAREGAEAEARDVGD